MQVQWNSNLGGLINKLPKNNHISLYIDAVVFKLTGFLLFAKFIPQAKIVNIKKSLQYLYGFKFQSRIFLKEY